MFCVARRANIFWLTLTQREKTLQMLQCIHQGYNVQTQVSHADAIVQAAKTLTDTLKGTVPSNLGETSLEELERLAELFNNTAKTMSEIEAAAT